MESQPRKIRIAGGKIHDPTNGVDGLVGDIWIVDGKIISPPTKAAGFNTIDATGRVIMAGGIDMHCHIAGSCLLYTSPSPRDRQKSRMPSSA